jgi:hypothetical protein
VRAGDGGLEHFTAVLHLQQHLRFVRVTPRASRAAAKALQVAVKANAPKTAAKKRGGKQKKKQK